jgi:hypothetical protein
MHMAHGRRFLYLDTRDATESAPARCLLVRTVAPPHASSPTATAAADLPDGPSHRPAAQHGKCSSATSSQCARYCCSGADGTKGDSTCARREWPLMRPPFPLPPRLRFLPRNALLRPLPCSRSPPASGWVSGDNSPLEVSVSKFLFVQVNLICCLCRARCRLACP